MAVMLRKENRQKNNPTTVKLLTKTSSERSKLEKTLEGRK